MKQKKKQVGAKNAIADRVKLIPPWPINSGLPTPNRHGDFMSPIWTFCLLGWHIKIWRMKRFGRPTSDADIERFLAELRGSGRENADGMVK